MNSHNVCIVGFVAFAGVSSMASAQNSLLSVRPIRPLSSVEPMFILPGGRVRSAPAMTGTEALGPTVFFDDFSTYNPTDYTNVPLSLVPLNGQVNPAGMPWTGLTVPPPHSWFGVATVGIMQAAGGTVPIGDSPAFGPITNFAAAARKTGQDAYNSSFNSLANYRVGLVAPQIGSPVVAAQDIYLSSIDNQPRTNLWWSPVSAADSFILDRAFYGGTNLTNVLAFANNSVGVMDRFVSLGPLLGNYTIGQFYAPSQHPNFPPPVNEWFTVMFNFSHNDSTASNGYSLWIKTPETVASNPPFIDPRMAAGDIPPIDNNPVGWVNTYPGFPDDPATPGVIEGIGLGVTQFGVPAPTTSVFNQAPPFALSFDEIQYGTGSDDPNDPTFAADDYFFANFRAHGITTSQPCRPDFNGDRLVDSADLAFLLVNWNPQPFGSPADLNADGKVDAADLANLLASWGGCPL